MPIWKLGVRVDVPKSLHSIPTTEEPWVRVPLLSFLSLSFLPCALFSPSAPLSFRLTLTFWWVSSLERVWFLSIRKAPESWSNEASSLKALRRSDEGCRTDFMLCSASAKSGRLSSTAAVRESRLNPGFKWEEARAFNLQIWMHVQIHLMTFKI